jgi:hypothetical protein
MHATCSPHLILLLQVHMGMNMNLKWDLKFSWQRVWCSELSSRIYCRVKWLSTDVSEVRTSETSVDNHFTRQYIPEDNSEHELEASNSCPVSNYWP